LLHQSQAIVCGHFSYQVKDAEYATAKLKLSSKHKYRAADKWGSVDTRERGFLFIDGLGLSEMVKQC